MSITLGRERITIGSPSVLDALQDQYRTHRHVVLENFVDRPLLAAVLKQVESGSFYKRFHENDSWELCLRGNIGWDILQFLTNRADTFSFIRELTGCDYLQSFKGRIYRCVPGAGHYDSWHDDIGAENRVAMSLNLSPEPYDGGALLLRDRRTSTLLGEVHNIGFGDAVLFEIAPGLQHKIMETVGTNAKTAYAGWFSGEAGVLNALRSGGGGLP